MRGRGFTTFFTTMWKSCETPRIAQSYTPFYIPEKTHTNLTMSEEVRVILVGEKWEAKEKMSDNLMFKMKASESLKSQGEEMAKLLGRPDLGGLEFFKGKGKPPAVTPGVKLNLSKVASDVATKAGSIVIYVKEKEKKEKTAAPPSNNVKLLLCGDDWKAKTKLSDNLMADIKKDQTLESSLPDILKLLKLSSLEGYHLCKGRGKAPEITAGTTMDLARTPESLNLQAAAFVYVKKVKKADAAKPKEVRQAIYQLGSLVDLQDEDTDEWTGGQVTVLHNDGSYDVSLVSGAVVRFVDADDLRVSTVCKKWAKKTTFLKNFDETAKRRNEVFHFIFSACIMRFCTFNFSLFPLNRPKQRRHLQRRFRRNSSLRR